MKMKCDCSVCLVSELRRFHAMLDLSRHPECNNPWHKEDVAEFSGCSSCGQAWLSGFEDQGKRGARAGAAVGRLLKYLMGRN